MISVLSSMMRFGDVLRHAAMLQSVSPSWTCPQMDPQVANDKRARAGEWRSWVSDVLAPWI